MQTYLINLDRSTGRLAEFHRVNPHLRNIARFPAVDGHTIDRQKLIDNNVFTESVVNKYSPGAIGCALSHLRLWNIAMEGGEPITAVEDDAILHKDFDTLTAGIVASLPEGWDIVVWGFNMDSVLVYELPGGISVCTGSFIDNKIAANREAYQNAPLQAGACRLIASFGTVCYSVSPAGARKLTDMAVPLRDFLFPVPGLDKPVGNHGIDIVMAGIYSRINAYVSYPPLALTPNETSASTIAGS